MTNLYTVIKKPVISEKSVSNTADNHYVFYVDKAANKITVMQAMREIYGISPISVKMINLPRKVSGRGRVKRLMKRKAIVVLNKNDKLDITKMKFL
ncbi:50S ribosomal protein L23 [Candidatus Gracilibacteria bacterium]|jgi:large subunit ribosomal protein L23|nr:50S ribosomal protein L23 [Candidatus Gracilibacteria bacterium]